MAKNSANVVDNQDVVNVEKSITLRLIHNYGANIVFGDIVLQPNISVVISQKELEALETNSNFKHYTKVGVIEKFLAFK